MSSKKFYDFGHLHQSAAYANEDLAGVILKRTDALNEIWLADSSKLKAIKSSGKYSIKGQQSERAELVIEVKKQIKEWLAAQDNLDDQIRQLENEMSPKRNRVDDVVGEMRQREIRDVLRTLDPIDVEEKYMSASRAGDELFLSAVEESPVPFSFAAKGLVEKVRFSRLQRAYPEQATKLADLKIGKANILSALKAFEVDLGKMGLNVAPDSLADA